MTANDQNYLAQVHSAVRPRMGWHDVSLIYVGLIDGKRGQVNLEPCF